MTIIDNRSKSKEVPLNTLLSGECFYFDGHLCIKLVTIRDTRYRAVRLSDGDLYILESTQLVTPVNAEVIIKNNV